ncbi:MAG: hypothetical protein RLZZ342_621 [Candidatus Parcubacteria bacterium]|jgi:tRNA threonylcarbamoyladenosine biosynthesis protein TsaE
MVSETHSLNEFNVEVTRFARKLMPCADHSVMVVLSGDLGVGKTTFVQAVARALGIQEPVRSPTFIIMQIFELPAPAQSGFARFIHIDAYRLKHAGELEMLGWGELIADPRNLIFMEWPEQVLGAVPEWAQKVTLGGDGDTRRITYGSDS